MTPVAGPQGELGTAVGGVWASLARESEHVPELRAPAAFRTYRRMLTDAQVHGLHLGFGMPVRRRTWAVDPDGATEQATIRVARNFGLPIRGTDDHAPQAHGSFDRLLGRALLAPAYGRYDLEIVGQIVDGAWEIERFAPRPPWTITQPRFADNGELEALAMPAARPRSASGVRLGGTVDVPIGRLLSFVWGDDDHWAGSSVLRPMYRNWLVKDRLIRVDALKHERNGMGVPVVEEPEKTTQPQRDALSAIAQQLRAGEEIGGTTPHGAKLRLVGVEGTLPDTLASIRYHDEQMSKALVQMVIDLGQTPNGSRALGGTFAGLLSLLHDAAAESIAGTLTEQAAAISVLYNEGQDASVPRVVCENIEDEVLAVEDLGRLADAGLLTPDPVLEDALRSRHNLPGRGTPAPPPPASAAAASRASRRPRPTSAASDQDARRDPLPHEAAVDFDAIEATQADITDELVAAALVVQSDQVEQLRQQIEDADGDLQQLATLSATAAGSAAFTALLVRAVREGAAGAATELGVDAPDLSRAETQAAARATALALILADDLSAAARRRALALTAEDALEPEQVAATVADDLGTLTDAHPRRELGAATHTSQHSGRVASIEHAIEQLDTVSIYASELLDSATCGPCADADGRTYATLADALQDYPAGGYLLCEGGSNCRGTLVAIADTESAPTVGVA